MHGLILEVLSYKMFIHIKSCNEINIAYEQIVHIN